MFKRISYTIALQFTAFVFLLFLVNGVLFLAADLTNARRETGLRLLRQAEQLLRSVPKDTSDIDTVMAVIPPPLKDRVRIARVDESILYEGGLFENLPFSPEQGVSHFTFQEDRYSLVTTAVLQQGRLIAYVQLAERERGQANDLPSRAVVYVLVSLLISGLTFVVGISFARRSLKPAERMVEKLEQFTQDASHELRTPLAVVNSSLDLALHTGQYKEGIESAKDDLKHISVLVERLLELARMDTFILHRDTVNLSMLVMDCVEKYRILAQEKNITITTDIAENVSVKGDEALLRQVLVNLLNNAIKFNVANGTIAIQVKKNLFSIQDTGIGIDPVTLPFIFDRFYQGDTSRAKEGFGLGLSLVKHIVDLHGWTIDVQSVQAKGTTFTIFFRDSGKKQKPLPLSQES